MTVTDLFIGKEPTTFEFEGTPVFIGPAVVVRAGHPIMKGREHLFTSLVVHFDVTEPEAPKSAKAAKPGPAAK